MRAGTGCVDDNERLSESYHQPVLARHTWSSYIASLPVGRKIPGDVTGFPAGSLMIPERSAARKASAARKKEATTVICSKMLPGSAASADQLPHLADELGRRLDGQSTRHRHFRREVARIESQQTIDLSHNGRCENRCIFGLDNALPPLPGIRLRIGHNLYLESGQNLGKGRQRAWQLLAQVALSFVEHLPADNQAEQPDFRQQQDGSAGSRARVGAGDEDLGVGKDPKHFLRCGRLSARDREPLALQQGPPEDRPDSRPLLPFPL